MSHPRVKVFYDKLVSIDKVLEKQQGAMSASTFEKRFLAAEDDVDEPGVMYA